jgi:hypothetical protein
VILAWGSEADWLFTGIALIAFALAVFLIWYGGRP